MHISCEKCSTTYALDERVLPPSGAPVQCTRCQHVFIAKPPSAGTAVGSPLPPPVKAQSSGAPAAPPVEPAQPKRAVTQMFGAPAVPPAADPVRKQTQMFGAPAVPPAADPVRKQTQMFGAPAVPPAAGEPAGSPTQMFGGAPETTPKRSSTQRFGVAPAAAPETTPKRSSTQMFGAPPAAPPEAPTQRSPTQMFGSPAAAPEAAPARASTQMFGATPSDPEASVVPPPRASTQMFGVPAMDPTEGEPFEEPLATRPKTLMFGALTSLQPPLVTTDKYGVLPPGSPRPPAAELAPAASKRSPIELPPETPELKMAASSAAAAADGFESRLAARRRTWPAVLGLIAIGVATFWGVRAFLTRRAEIPVEWTTARQEAASLLRRDDPAAYKQATDRLTELVRARPDYLEAQADLVVALAFRLDDAQLNQNRIQATATELNRKVRELQEAQSPSDWVNRTNALREELIALDKKNEPLIQEAKALGTSLNQAFAALQGKTKQLSPVERQALTRAEAIYYGVRGQDDALRKSQAYESQGGAGGWGQIAYAEYALNAKAPPATLAQAKSQIDALREKDQTFLRLYVLSARLSLAQKQYEDASSTLEAVAAMNKSHTVAAQLLEWVQEKQREEGPSP